jgi:prolyl-tRNA editing enzyme YbaK/EbsC (Cys-tRNA(Pro) deacylase)
VVADRKLAGQEVLYFAGGDPTAILKIRGEDLVKATGAKVARIARPMGEGGANRRRWTRIRS